MQSFLVGPRQIGLSTMPYLKSKDPLKAFSHSPKLQEAHKRMMEHLKDPRTKALVFSNFINAGLTPYSAALTKAGVPNAIFHGGLSDVERKKLVESYNQGQIRVALMGPSGTEGLSFRGTQLIQLLDSSWNSIRPQQSIGRGLRFDSHVDLPGELQNLKVERYVARLPMGFKDRLLSRLGADRMSQTYGADDYLRQIEHRKQRTNQRFLQLLQEIGTAR
jgi:superfamily II DNA/RNA helicase